MQGKRSHLPTFDNGAAAVDSKKLSPLSPPPSPRQLPALLEGGNEGIFIRLLSPHDMENECSGRCHIHGPRMKPASFLEKCHLCGKRISKKDDIFMFGDMRGFCTPECREKQIIKEKFVEMLDLKPGDGILSASTSVNNNSRLQTKNEVEKFVDMFNAQQQQQPEEPAAGSAKEKKKKKKKKNDVKKDGLGSSGWAAPKVSVTRRVLRFDRIL